MINKYYFLGHETLTNRGCEALLRGISRTIREQCPGAEFFAPSFDIENDLKQWKDAKEMGISFIPAYHLPLYVRVWGKIDKFVPQIRHFWIPSPKIPNSIRQSFRGPVAGIMTGGDVLSLDYGVPSLIKFIGQAETFMAEGHKLFLWAASVGPFESQPEVEKHVIRHLAKYSGISVRETSTRNYLDGLGLRNVKLVADPAFVMIPEPWDISAILPASPCEGFLGFNISPLIKRFRTDDAHVSEMELEVVGFLRDVIKKTDLSIVLIPHVDGANSSEWNSDYLYMKRLIARIDLPPEIITARISLAPRDMNAVQTKYLISQCRFFIGARTHATIAAWSTLVPTISIAYSIKAIGLNTDLFGDLRYVLETSKLSRMALWESLEKLRTDEQNIRKLLEQRIPEWQQRARLAGMEVFG
ncbi:polysaccharide pyruvyl transferase family protein [Nitrosomonas sp. Is35]|uniref:polysaccharide pyruvyl transferase family protein n=1 Tax=Nitrosomonas sp. Is35 TaxID=3080534 RepID=UPI00294AE416|nr:polysaccharide pyruvyl transferase family protein [Nitrosomonas sp. Is35]MDV6346613.1 polysaccharide pyruvyl transferase family protein [Nitrosomonas sp. Is35]